MRELPIRILDTVPSEPVISVDGAWAAPGLNLSHWPGNATPRELRHDLSTGIALNFVRLPEARARELARDCVAIANNHYDTDGVLALFALARPEVALEHAGYLLETAATGDLFRFPSERAFALDRVIDALAQPDSPWAALSRGLEGSAKHELLVRELVERLPSLLANGLAEFESLWKPALERQHADLAELCDAGRDELVHLDLAVWSDARELAPGRHALFGATDCDRALVLGQQDGLTTCRFVVNTSSWFDLVTRTAPPRPDLLALVGRLNELECTQADTSHAWRAQPADNPAPELWFGGAELEFFAEHNGTLGGSRLDPLAIKREIVESLRRAWVFPEDG